MAEQADALDSKSSELCARAGSTPAFGTKLKKFKADESRSILFWGERAAVEKRIHAEVI